jgi:hypothetical protein
MPATLEVTAKFYETFLCLTPVRIHRTGCGHHESPTVIVGTAVAANQMTRIPEIRRVNAYVSRRALRRSSSEPSGSRSNEIKQQEKRWSST